MKKLLVTGGVGFIGSAFCRHAVAGGSYSIVNVDLLTYAANPRSLDMVDGQPAYRFVRADICDREALGAIFAEHRPDAVIHFAAESHVDRSIDRAVDFIGTNIVGTYALLEAAREYWDKLQVTRREAFRFLHVSTDEVFGSLGPEGAFQEATAYDPSSPYSASKAAADHLVTAWHRTYGFPALISISSNNYGPYQFPEKLIPLMILNGLEGKPLSVYGDGSHIRDWLYVGDNIRALLLILENGRIGEKYNVGGGNERTNLQVVEQICDLLDAERPSSAPHRNLISFVSDRPGHDRRYAIDAEKIKTELGWRALENFETGLAKTVGWYLGNEAWWGPLRTGVYKGERLGLFRGRSEAED